jgi:hypothetical protein
LNTEINETRNSEDEILTPTTEAIVPTKSRAFRNLFIGDCGLRPGWSLLIFITIFGALMALANVVGHNLHPSEPPTPIDKTTRRLTSVLVSTSIPLLAILIVTLIMSKIEKRRFSVYGLGGKHKVSHFFTGLAWGVTCLSVLIFTLWKTGLLLIENRLLFGTDVFRYGAIWLFGFFLVALFEESLTRGYLLFTIARGFAGLYEWIFKTRHHKALGFWTAALLLSFLFGLGHGSNASESSIGLLSAGLASLVFCLSLWRTGSLWWAIGFHTTWDWAQSFLYGVADSGTMVQHHLFSSHPAGRPILSGGATGPEGSIFILALLAFISLIILFTLPRALYGDTKGDLQLVCLGI